MKIHLYISTSPCGDARIFSPHENKDADNHPNRKARGQLRTKVGATQGIEYGRKEIFTVISSFNINPSLLTSNLTCENFFDQMGFSPAEFIQSVETMFQC